MTEHPRTAPGELEILGRAEFERHLAFICERRTGAIPQCLLVLRVERLRDVTERCGAPGEEALLQVLWAMSRDLAAPGTTGCRLDTDHLALLKERVMPADAPLLARRLRSGLDGARFAWRGLSFRLGVSVGVLDPHAHPASPSEIIERASAASDQAEGLAGVVVAEGRSGEEADAERDREWREHLREVIG